MSCRFCEGYEAAIHRAGGIDVQLLGMGRMGHIGFNESGCVLASAMALFSYLH